MKLTRTFYASPTLVVARRLLGMHLVHRTARGLRIGRIVETEAYLGPQDLAAHSCRGQTERNAVMFGPPGRAYVYFVYGMWHCFNVVTRAAGIPQAVLVRAVEPVQGIDDATWGPGLLCRAMDIDLACNGTDLTGRDLWIEAPPEPLRPVRIGRAPRVGVDYAADWAAKPWRFMDRDSPCVSTVPAGRRRQVLSRGTAGKRRKQGSRTLSAPV